MGDQININELGLNAPFPEKKPDEPRNNWHRFLPGGDMRDTTNRYEDWIDRRYPNKRKGQSWKEFFETIDDVFEECSINIDGILLLQKEFYELDDKNRKRSREVILADLHKKTEKAYYELRGMEYTMDDLNEG